MTISSLELFPVGISWENCAFCTFALCSAMSQFGFFVCAIEVPFSQLTLFFRSLAENQITGTLSEWNSWTKLEFL
jgi:ABC-type proline/glycine betaine transport system substrate-binding protein